MEMPEPTTPPAADTPPSPERDGRHPLSRLRGEDGYDIFADDVRSNARERLRREHEDSRW